MQGGDSQRTKELLYRVLAYNCHRMCMISTVLWMISREPEYRTQNHELTQRKYKKMKIKSQMF